MLSQKAVGYVSVLQKLNAGVHFEASMVLCSDGGKILEHLSIIHSIRQPPGLSATLRLYLVFQSR